MGKLTIGPPLDSYTAESFYDYVKSLYKAPNAASKSKTVGRIGLTRKADGGLLVRIEGPKELLDTEVALLSEEYQIPMEELTRELTKRKFKIMNACGDVLNVSPKPKRQPKASKRTKKDADSPSGAGEALC